MDEVRTKDNQRLDRDDFEGSQELNHEALRTALGGLVPKGGVLAGMAFDTETLSATTIDAGIILTQEVIPQGRLVRVTRHDPTATWQAGLSQVDLSGIDPGTPYIWARRELVDHDVETRREWDTLSGTEVPITPPTRRRARLIFGVGTSAPDGSEGWEKIARVASWDSGVPTIYRLHPFDLLWSGGESGRNRSTALLFDSTYVVGLPQVVTFLIQQVASIISRSAEDSWLTAPPAGISDLANYHDIDGRKVLFSGRVEHIDGANMSQMELKDWQKSTGFDGTPAWEVPGEFFETSASNHSFRVSGKARHVYIQQKMPQDYEGSGVGMQDPTHFTVSEISYFPDQNYSFFVVTANRIQDLVAVPASYHIMVVGTPTSATGD